MKDKFIPKNCVCSAFVARIRNKCNRSASDTHSTSKYTLKKPDTYGLLKRSACTEDQTCYCTSQERNHEYCAATVLLSHCCLWFGLKSVGKGR